MTLSQHGTVNVFFSLAAAPRDRRLFDELRKHLSNLKRQGIIDVWHDSMISAGSTLKEIIKARISTADIIVLLLSADFFASEQCTEVEMPWALEQHAQRAAQVIPVLLRPADWNGFPLEQYQPLPTNGKAISTWKDRDSAFTEVAKGIRSVVEELARHLRRTPRPVQPPQFPLYLFPFRQNPFFTDREVLLNELYHNFIAQKSPNTRIQVMYGLGGIGKTLLATEYIYSHQNEYQAIFWLDAATPELLHANILTIASHLGIATHVNEEEQHIAVIQAWLQEHDRWLLVLDNLDTLEDVPLLNELLPLNSNGHVLLITHAQTSGTFATAVSVSPMSIEESALLLLRRAQLIPSHGSRVDASKVEYSQALAIAQEVEGYPLALDQAGAYIEETQHSLAWYLKHYQQRKAALLSKRGRLAKDHPDPVTTTLSLTFKKIAQFDPEALELLHFFAFLHPDALPDEMLQYGASTLHEPLRTLALDPLALDAAIATLRRFSLVHQRADATTLNMHSIIQVLLKKDLPKRQQLNLAKQAVKLINRIFPDVLFANWEECERYAPHALHCATLISEFGLSLQEGGELLERLGSYYYQRGCSTDAEKYLSQALHVQERLRHGDTVEIAQTLNSLGLLFRRQGRYADAARAHQRALAIRERVLDADDPQIAESLHNLAVLHKIAEQYEQAQQFYLRALALDERTQGPEHLDTLRTLNNLALVYYLQGDYEQAEIIYRRALTLYERASPPGHPDMAYTLNGLGAVAEKRRDDEQAATLYQRALALREQTLGKEHSETAHSINKVAHILELQGDYMQAQDLYQRALSILEQTLGPDHPDVALLLNNLALLQTKQEQYQQAEQLYQRALQIYEQSQEDESTNFAQVIVNLGHLYKKIGDKERAQILFKRALAIHEKVLGATHPDTLQIQNELEDLLKD